MIDTDSETWHIVKTWCEIAAQADIDAICATQTKKGRTLFLRGRIDALKAILALPQVGRASQINMKTETY